MTRSWSLFLRSSPLLALLLLSSGCAIFRTQLETPLGTVKEESFAEPLVKSSEPWVQWQQRWHLTDLGLAQGWNVFTPLGDTAVHLLDEELAKAVARREAARKITGVMAVPAALILCAPVVLQNTGGLVLGIVGAAGLLGGGLIHLGSEALYQRTLRSTVKRLNEQVGGDPTLPNLDEVAKDPRFKDNAALILPWYSVGTGLGDRIGVSEVSAWAVADHMESLGFAGDAGRYRLWSNTSQVGYWASMAGAVLFLANFVYSFGALSPNHYSDPTLQTLGNNGAVAFLGGGALFLCGGMIKSNAVDDFNESLKKKYAYPEAATTP